MWEIAGLFILTAFFFMALRAWVWQLLLKRSELSKVYPYSSLVQGLILVYAVVFFKESFSFYNLTGMIIMISGLVYLSRHRERA